MPTKTKPRRKSKLTAEEREERRQQQRERAAAAVEALGTEDGFRAWIESRKNFRSYSARNQWLILVQLPEATRVGRRRDQRQRGRGEGRMTDDNLTREQLSKLEALAVRHGSVACEKIHGSDEVYAVIDPTMASGFTEDEHARLTIDEDGQITETESLCPGEGFRSCCETWKLKDDDECRPCTEAIEQEADAAHLRRRGVRNLSAYDPNNDNRGER